MPLEILSEITMLTLSEDSLQLQREKDVRTKNVHKIKLVDFFIKISLNAFNIRYFFNFLKIKNL